MKGKKEGVTLGVTSDPGLRTRGIDCCRDLIAQLAELEYELCNPYLMISMLNLDFDMCYGCVREYLCS